ncbi:glycine cleavage system protein R [Phycicoccus flavus]|uniref:glycine cleavage system protein R n=1 Tax=Phycicoccus flavus TaxID=2502783 RepID=UPI000FEBDDF7|nr:ACT domain-containing protein [Phycicoccus flavus]NHA69283.1 amino acid-binding ACT protein [Phycicoccus flavus]
MIRLVLTVIGDDRSGLVKALADVVAEHDGNWETSQLAEVAGKFAGIVVVAVPPDRASALQDALTPLRGMLEVEVRGEVAADEPPAADTRAVVVEIVGNDRPGIVQAVSGVLAAHGLGVAELETDTREAPMAGGRLFEARAVVTVPAGADTADLRAALEEIADEVLVDLAFEEL